MIEDDLKDLKTFCCGANYLKVSRAFWVCDDCKQDRSLEFVLIYEAMVKDEF